jgi:hypothetical protein
MDGKITRNNGGQERPGLKKANEAGNRVEPKRSKKASQAECYFACKEDQVEADGMWPLYTTDRKYDSASRGTSKQDMEFVRRTMLSASVQDVVAKVDLATRIFWWPLTRVTFTACDAACEP